MERPGPRVGGIVLCGGQSKRMGRPKTWLPFGSELMLPRVVRLLREAVDPVVVVAAPDQEVPPLPDEVTIVRDEVEGTPRDDAAAGVSIRVASVRALVHPRDDADRDLRVARSAREEDESPDCAVPALADDSRG